MAKPKPETAWCVVSKDGEYFLWSVGWRKTHSVYAYVEGLVRDDGYLGNPYYHKEWKEAKRNGYRCVKVTIQPREE